MLIFFLAPLVQFFMLFQTRPISLKSTYPSLRYYPNKEIFFPFFPLFFWLHFSFFCFFYFVIGFVCLFSPLFCFFLIHFGPFFTFFFFFFFYMAFPYKVPHQNPINKFFVSGCFFPFFLFSLSFMGAITPSQHFEFLSLDHFSLLFFFFFFSMAFPYKVPHQNPINKFFCFWLFFSIFFAFIVFHGCHYPIPAL